ncbi:MULTISPECIES: PA1571 family protein [Alcanivorax]|uniref:PA1571 family protein n=1 Tax=Alcanivorax TaxID=59753 RepID=UPI001415088A|nr:MULTISPECIES: PA1571 family protein [Alcanivorax]
MSRTTLSRSPGSGDFNDAALVDEQGREIPITEAMILKACRELEQAWRYPRQADRKAG